MEDNRCIPHGHSAGGYPTIRAEGHNTHYAQAMLSNIGGCSSELSCISLYFYNHLITAGVPEVSEVFHRISVIEMHHLEIFGTLALQLGADPRFWSMQQGRKMWWSPDYLHYTRKLTPLLHNALREERAALRKYENQARWIKDWNVVENLRRVIQDERQHIEMITRLCENYAIGTPGHMEY